MIDHEAYLALLEALHQAIQPERDIWQNAFAVRKAEVSFRFVHHAMRNHGMPVVGTTCVDLGCGAVNPFGRLFPLLMLGAKQMLCFELDRPLHPEKFLRYLADLVAAAIVDPKRVFGDHPVDRQQLLANIADFDLAKLARGDASGVPMARARLVEKSIVATGLEAGSADLLVSNSVLEHLPDVEAALAEFARITAVGGYGIHGIDVIDHRSYPQPAFHPLEFLTIRSSDRLVHECNRIRLHEFEALFARHGLVVLDQWRGPRLTVPETLRQRLVEPWRSMPVEQLEYGWSQFLVQKQ